MIRVPNPRRRLHHPPVRRLFLRFVKERRRIEMGFEQFFDLTAQFRIVFTGQVQKLGALGSG